MTDNENLPVVLVADLAEKAGVTVGNIRQLLLSGKIKGRKLGGIWIISTEEAQRYLEKRRGRTRAFFHREKKNE